MDRRAFLNALAVLSAGGIARQAFAAPPSAAPPQSPPPSAGNGGGVIVVHLTAYDSDVCRRWDQRYLLGWMKSPQYRRVTYHRVEGNTAAEALNPKNWPAALRPYRGVEALKTAPSFIVFHRSQPVAAAAGLDGWATQVWPAIYRLTV